MEINFAPHFVGLSLYLQVFFHKRLLWVNVFG